MTDGDLFFSRFPITLDVDAPVDSVPQIGTTNALFAPAAFDIILPEILPITGTGGKSKGVVVVIARTTV